MKWEEGLSIFILFVFFKNFWKYTYPALINVIFLYVILIKQFELKPTFCPGGPGGPGSPGS